MSVKPFKIQMKLVRYRNTMSVVSKELCLTLYFNERERDEKVVGGGGL